MKKSKLESDQTKQDILNAAIEIFEEKTYDSTTIENIAKRAGVTRGAVYWHFKNKFDIFSELTDILVDSFFRKQFRIIDNMEVSSIEKIVKILEVYFEKVSSDESVFKFRKMTNFKLSNGEDAMLINLLLGEVRRMILKKVKDYVEIGQKKNEIRDDVNSNFLVISILGSGKFYEELMLTSNDNLDVELSKEEVFEGFRKILMKV